VQIKVHITFEAHEKGSSSLACLRDDVLLFLMQHHIDVYEVREHATGQRTYIIDGWRTNGSTITKTVKEVRDGQTL